MNKVKRLFNILLMLVNNIGIVGALVSILEIPWDSALDPVLFWSAVFLFCVAAAFLWKGRNRSRILCRVVLCLILYVFLAFVFWEELFAGITLVLQGPAEKLGEIYGFRIYWPQSALLQETGRDAEELRTLGTMGMLAILFPLELAAGYFAARGSWLPVAAGNLLWFTAACACNVFPDFFYLVFCVLGVLAGFARRDFRNDPVAGLQAALWMAAFTGLAMGCAYFIVLPAADEQYERSLLERQQFYMEVNQEWIPRIRSFFAGHGMGAGVDVSGELGRKEIFSDTLTETYLVTADSLPRGTLYLKGFAGKDYGKDAWKADTDAHFREYYEREGLKLPEDFRHLVNIGWEAARAMQGGEPGRLAIQELGGSGSYSLYPCGAFLTDGYQVNSDGTCARRDTVYEFEYYLLEGHGRNGRLPWGYSRLEQQYRQYVYDNYLEYPREELAILTKQLENSDIRRDSIYQCVLDIAAFLEGQASYDLGAGNNPAGTDFVEYFLFESHSGYCMHFASAAVLILRYFGIPARYVTGYAVSPGKFTQAGTGEWKATLTGENAHAWAEVYLDAVGWVPVEMTPGTAATGDSRAELLVRMGTLEGDIIMQSSAREEARQATLRELEQARMEAAARKEAEEPGRPWFLDPEGKAEKDGEALTEGSSQAAPALQQGGKGSQDPSGMTGQAPALGSGEGSENRERQKAPVLESRKGSPGFLLLNGLGAVLLIWGLRRGIPATARGRIRYWHRKLERASARDRIALMYGNLERALRLAGYAGKGPGDEQALRRSLKRMCPEITDAECRKLWEILERSSFAREEPSSGEQSQVWAIQCAVVRKAFAAAPVRRRLWLWLRVYSG
ncbi:MAG: transglutaminase-like domain-containing protein [Acetatifactor sp.]|nr:transglutaminase-like domain-containing protein [Acetatifactor sp.]